MQILIYRGVCWLEFLWGVDCTGTSRITRLCESTEEISDRILNEIEHASRSNDRGC